MTALDHDGVAMIVDLLRKQGFTVKRPTTGAGANAYSARKGTGRWVTFGPSTGAMSMEQTLSRLRRAGAGGTSRWPLPGRRRPSSRRPSSRAIDNRTPPAAYLGRMDARALPEDIVEVAKRRTFEFAAWALDQCAGQHVGVFEAIAAVIAAEAVVRPSSGAARYVRGDVCAIADVSSSGAAMIHNVIDLGREGRALPRVALSPPLPDSAPAAPVLDSPEESAMPKGPSKPLQRTNLSRPGPTAGDDIAAHVASLPAGTRFTLAELRAQVPQHTDGAISQAAHRLARQHRGFRLLSAYPAIFEVTTVDTPDAPVPTPASMPQTRPPADTPAQPETAVSGDVSGPALASVHALVPRNASGVEHTFDIGGPPPEEPDALTVALGRFSRDAAKLRRDAELGVWARLLHLSADALPPELSAGGGARLNVQLVPDGAGGLDVYARWSAI